MINEDIIHWLLDQFVLYCEGCSRMIYVEGRSCKGCLTFKDIMNELMPIDDDICKRCIHHNKHRTRDYPCSNCVYSPACAYNDHFENSGKTLAERIEEE